jgi:branched-chain amino acid transport system substrate-binding protein
MNAQRALVGSLAIASAVPTFAVGPVCAQETVKIGFSAPITGPFAENGRQMSAAVKLYIERYGANVAGKKIEVILRDDGGVADQAKRIARELVVVNKVAILAGYNPTPPALAVALANKMARIAWAVLAKGETYRAPTRSSNAAIAAAA